MTMAPEIAAILADRPALPPARERPMPAFRQAVAQGCAAAPKLAVELAEVRDFTIPGPECEIPVRLYRPLAGRPPLMVFLHGGGYVIGDLNISDPHCRALAHGAQCAVLSVDYRLAPEHPYPKPFDDAYAALEWAARNAEALGCDPARLAVGGDSAGANLAAGCALKARDVGGPRIVAQMLMYPSTEYPHPPRPSMIEHAATQLLSADDCLYYWDAYLGADEGLRRDPYACPAHAGDHAALPPAFIATAELDPSRDGGEAYADRLANSGVPTELRRYAGMPHGFFTWLGHSARIDAAMAEICAWLRERMGEA
jgi:acetyl esterase